jgi:hypothetical protein
MPLLSDIRAQHQCFCSEKRVYYHYKQFKKCNCCRWQNLCYSAEADRNLAWRDFAMQIRLFIVILALLLCVIAVRADKPIVTKESEATCPRAASFCLACSSFAILPKSKENASGRIWESGSSQAPTQMFVRSRFRNVKRESPGLAPSRCHFSLSMRIKAGVQRCAQ